MKKKPDIIAIGIAGLIGSGKSEALKFFRNKNIKTSKQTKQTQKKHTETVPYLYGTILLPPPDMSVF